MNIYGRFRASFSCCLFIDIYTWRKLSERVWVCLRVTNVRNVLLCLCTVHWFITIIFFFSHFVNIYAALTHLLNKRNALTDYRLMILRKKVCAILSTSWNVIFTTMFSTVLLCVLWKAKKNVLVPNRTHLTLLFFCCYYYYWYCRLGVNAIVTMYRTFLLW